MKECIGTTTASVLVNSSFIREFSLKKGLGQCDPLSPFLFLLVVEGLNVMMSVMVENNLFKGHRIDQNEPALISRHEFVDDTLIMGKKVRLMLELCKQF